MRAKWPGVLDPAFLNDEYVKSSNHLADAARAGKWADVYGLLDSDAWLTPNQWRVGGRSWFTPLHQAAWLGVPVEVVEELIGRGAWRSLRDASGARAVDIAHARGHTHLLDSLTTPNLDEPAKRKFAAWNRNLATLIAERTQRLRPVRFRDVPTEIIALESLDSLWCGYPGMYGGFAMSIRNGSLVVNSWNRIIGGSGRSHVITEGGCALIEEGFV